MKTIGDRLKKLRETAGLNQKQMADFLNIGKAGYNRIEKGFIDLTLKHIVRISTKFEVSLDWLLLGKEFDNFGEFNATVKEMLSDMGNDPVFMHGMFSYYHQMKQRKSKSNDNDNDNELELKHEK
jgi:transcriptional regulator with XRE-family HTH domain